MRIVDRRNIRTYLVFCCYRCHNDTQKHLDKSEWKGSTRLQFECSFDECESSYLYGRCDRIYVHKCPICGNICETMTTNYREELV